MAGPAEKRARRLLALLHLLERDTRVSLNLIAKTLGASVPEITEDLNTLACCGVAPYDPLAMMPIFVEDGMVEVFGELPALDCGVRLSSAEAHALSVALQMAGMSAQDSLVIRLMEATGAPSVSPQEIEKTVRSAAAPGASEVFAPVIRGLRDRQVVHLAYLATSTGVMSERDVEPMQLLAERGVWYIEAYCRTAGALRTFRLDRVHAARVLDERFEPRDLSPAGRALSTDSLPTALVRFAPGEEFSDREWPGSRMIGTDPDGSRVVAVPFAGTAWIARQVAARLGAAEVLEPPAVRQAVATLAATYVA